MTAYRQRQPRRRFGVPNYRALRSLGSRVLRVPRGRLPLAAAAGAVASAALFGGALYAAHLPQPLVLHQAAATASPTPLNPAGLATPAVVIPTLAADASGVAQGVPSGAQQGASPYAALANPAPTPTPGLLRPSQYTVRPGDSLVAIADRFSLRPDTLIWANNLGNADLIVSGQDLVIPPADGVMYTVQAGERLVDIADRYGVNAHDVAVANAIANADVLIAGQTIFLPGARPLGPAGGVAQPGDAGSTVQAAAVEQVPMTAELQAVLASGWAQTTADLQLTNDAGAQLQTIPAGARLERIGDLSGRRIPVRDPGDGRQRLAMTGWVDALSLEAATAPSPRELPRSYPDDTRMDISQVFAPYRSQLDGTAYSLANCGPTSLSMALAAFGVDASPGQLRAEVQDAQHMWGNGVGSLITALGSVAEAHGLHAVGLYNDDGGIHQWSLDELRAQLAQKRPVIVQVRYRALPGREYVAYYGDHYIVLTGTLDDGFLYNDPIDHDGIGWDRIMSAERLTQAMDASDARYKYAAVAIAQ